MPISSERHGGFGHSKWELNYLKCRYKAHRNQVSAAKPAIDSQSPPERLHVKQKSKKALGERLRQVGIMRENMRILNQTAEIMSPEIPFPLTTSNSNKSSRRPGRPLTSMAKRNAHVVFQWFIHKFGHYVPWWAHVNY